MRKTFLKVSILAALGLAMSASFTSCKDYDSEINDLQGQVDALKQSISTLEGKINAGAVITGVSPIDNGYRFTLSDGKTYDITNGKNGENGKDGKDGESNLWTIVENAKGELVWALNGVATEYPAQGPAGEDGKPGENGESLPGIYYKPGENGFWIEVNPADGTEKETTIAWKPAATESLYAVVDNDKVVIYNFTDADGKAIDPVTIWKSSFIKSLVVKPELYLDGIEAARYGVAVQQNLQKPETARQSDDRTVETPNGITGTTATILAGQIWKTVDADKVNGNVPQFKATEIATLKYGANPSNAVLGNMKWNIMFDDIEVASRASDVAGVVKTAPVAVDKDGNVTIGYQLNYAAAYSKLMPTSTWYRNNKGQYTLADGTVIVNENGEFINGYEKDDAYAGPANKWTFMALQGANMQTDSCLVVSDNVALLKQWISFNNLIVKDNSNFDAKVPVAATAAEAIQSADDDAKNDVVIPAPYNQVLNLASYIAINVDKLTPMLGKVAEGTYNDKLTSQDMQDATGMKKDQVMTLKEAADKWALTPTFALVHYTIGNNKTSESQFAKIAADGKVTPQWVGTDGSQNDATTGDGGRSAIGRRPLVYVTLNNADGKVVLAGFVKIEWSQPQTTDAPIVLGNVKVPYICTYKHITDWETVTGGIYEKLGYTAEEFSKNFELESEYPYVLENGKYIMTYNNKDYYDYTANYGTFDWDTNPDGSHTQGLSFTVTNENYKTWYPRINPATGKYWAKEEFVTSEPYTKTLYAKFSSKNFHQIVYIGFNVTVVGAPAANYDGKLPSAWSQNVTPVNPAVPGQAMANVYGKNSFAQVMGMNFTSAWKGGDPVVKDSDPAYIWNPGYYQAGLYDVDNITANYRFSVNQPDYTGVSETKYAFYPGTNYGNTPTDKQHVLYAYYYYNGSLVKSYYEPIAVINVNDPINNELGSNGGAKGTTGTAAGVWNRIDFLSVYGYDAYDNVLSPAFNGNPAADGWYYGEFACDIINNAAYKFENPAITFNVEMVVTYSQNPKIAGEDATVACTLTIPGTYNFQAGVGRPITMTETKSASMQDAVSVGVPASKLFQVVDWQGHKLWNVNTNGTVSKAEFNGVNLGDYWMSLTKDGKDYSTVTWGKVYDYDAEQYVACSKSHFTIDLSNAYAYDGEELLGKFSAVYTDKQLSFSSSITDNNIVKLSSDVQKAEIYDWAALGKVTVNWENDGNSVTKDITIAVPVSVSYIWGQDIFLGYAYLTITPTLQGN